MNAKSVVVIRWHFNTRLSTGTRMMMRMMIMMVMSAQMMMTPWDNHKKYKKSHKSHATRIWEKGYSWARFKWRQPSR